MVLALFVPMCVTRNAVVKTTRKILISFLKLLFSVSPIISKCLSPRLLMNSCYLAQKIHLHPE